MMKPLHLLLLLLTAVLAGQTGYAAPAVPDTIPFEIGADRRIYVQVQLNGNTHRSFRFLFDTGATDIVLNASLPEVMAQAKFTQEVHNQGATSAEVIPSTSADQQLLLGHNNVKGLTFIAIAYPPEAWDGVLGLSFMKCFDIAIDYNRRQMYLYPPGKAPRPGKKGLPFTYRAGVPVVPVVAYINGKRHALQVELDSGSDRVLDINTPYVERHRLRGTLPVFAVSSIAGTGTANGQLENVFFDKLTLGPATFPLLPGAFPTLKSGLQASAEMDGVAGNNLLQRFNQLWDFRNQKLYLTVNHRYYLPFYDFLTATLKPRRREAERPMLPRAASKPTDFPNPGKATGAVRISSGINRYAHGSCFGFPTALPVNSHVPSGWLPTHAARLCAPRQPSVRPDTHKPSDSNVQWPHCKDRLCATHHK